MESKTKNDLSAHIILTFFIAFLTLPFLSLGGSNIGDGFRCTFITFPTNYLLYFAPLAVFLFLRKKKFPEKDSMLILSAICTVSVVIMHLAVQTNRSDYFFTLAATLIIAVVIININEAFSNVILLSGFIALLSPTAYIFTTYIPVLLLIMIYTSAKNRKDNKKSSFLLFAYLYIPVLILILLFTKKISIYIHPAYINYENSKSLTELFSGITLLLVAATVFIIRVLPVIRNGKTSEKISLVLFALYPLAIAVANCFFMLTSSHMSHSILVSLIMYIAGNIQISASYNSDELPLIPQKLNNPACMVIALLIFCTFCFK